ncbi:hypothetical protein AMK16_02940 [Streptomyces sp. CB00455]|uniref:AMP-binding protein n=1 Tax=Streptomyces sp. CB00455 TaxID=1703927 RepID=UPI00093A61FE|nr:AMP-binding protein [Streptomyces sp. CB00455]OKK22164.1 hypothetical protein AMK16_02940 [Streptomyces sp. CB00455]
MTLGSEPTGSAGQPEAAEDNASVTHSASAADTAASRDAAATTDTHEPSDTVLERFERWVRRAPGSRAVTAGPDSLTYGELEARANQLAHHLLDAGLPPGGLVAVGTDRQAELLVAVLAALKAGAAYTVIDVEAPHTGQRQLAAVRPFALLTHAAHQARLDGGRGLRVVRLGAEAAEIAARSTAPPARPASAWPAHERTAAYLFTGGAVPRPVPVSHARLLAAHDSWAEVAHPTPQDRHLITAGSAVTAFAAGWTKALCAGGSLVVPERAPWEPEAIRRAIDAEQVSVLHTDPAGAARLLLEGPVPRPAAPAGVPKARAAASAGPRALRLVTVTGDRLYLDEQAALQGRLRTGARLIGVYGPTETAGTGTRFELPQLSGPVDDPEQLCLLGTPFPGFRVDLRDGQVHLTPPDGGDAIPTGDLARLRSDGLLEFGGRLRDRITLAGRTLDPHRVESVIRGHEGVGGAIVSAVPGSAQVPRLVAYLVPPAADPSSPPGAGLPDAEALREHLADRLPAGERPRAVVRLRALPRTAAGQEDRDALPQPARPGAAHAGPRSSGKYGGAPHAGQQSLSCVLGCGSILLGGIAWGTTFALWPGSTDVTGVPQPWAFLFNVLYLFECLAFGLGVVFLFAGRARMPAQGHGRFLTKAAHLAIVYLLVAWWPQDNLYRLAAKHDWPRQAALVYTFNVPLMIAAAVVAYYVARRRTHHFDFGD